MRASRLANALLLSAAALLPACGSFEEEEQEASPDGLRADPNSEVSTTDSSVGLLSAYNSFLDRAPPTACVEARVPARPNVGDVRGTFYLRHVKTREELAKELDVEVGASLSVPSGSLDATTKVVKSFKQSSTTVTFLVRALRSYVVANRAELVLTPEARAMLEDKEDRTTEFLRKCGGSYVQNLRYEAQVLALMQFEAQTEESARKIATSLGGSTALVPLANASADIKTRAEQTAASENASLSLTVLATGFVSRGRATSNVVEHSFEKIDELRAELEESLDRDVEADRNDYFENRARNARPAVIGQASYAQIADAPDADYSRITTTLTRAEEFVRDLGPIQLRMETIHNDEVMRFLSDTQNQFRYNLVRDPKLKTQDLVPIAQYWAAKFGPDGTRQNGSLIDPLRMTIERCKSAAANGNYNACTTDRVIDEDKASAEIALADYAQSGRIVQLSAWMPRPNTTVSYRNAEDECRAASMRLPKREEMRFIAPTVTALAGAQGEVWFAGDAQCKKPIFSNGSGQGTFGCADSWSEGLPWMGDHPVVCVGLSGPIPALAAP